ncbi:hypothetical protein PQX77_017204 [Marasmius sp. AFHP31]|nr:hypothetical protein PQX77_017204 [Marasmius sp. AFHP31]
MSSTTFTTPTQNITPRASSGRAHGGAYTNRNINPLANTLNGDTDSFVSSTHIQNYQCQNPQSHYTNCKFYTGDHTPGTQTPRVGDPIAQANAPNSVQAIELRSPSIPPSGGGNIQRRAYSSR